MGKKFSPPRMSLDFMPFCFWQKWAMAAAQYPSQVLFPAQGLLLAEPGPALEKMPVNM